MGLSPYDLKPVLTLRDIVYFSIRQWEPEEMQLLQAQKIPWYESKVCTLEGLPKLKESVETYFFRHGRKDPYWLSFDIDAISGPDFKSTGTTEPNGLSLPFMLRFLEEFLPESVGMDFTEVNFALAQGEQRKKDEDTVRVIMEKAIDVV